MAMTDELSPHELTLAALEHIHSSARREASKVTPAIRAARKAGASWTEIGLRIGISRQAAWEKYHGVDDDDDD